MTNDLIDFWEFLLLPIYIGIILGIAFFIAPRTEKRLFMLAMSFRLGGALFFALIYIFYYKGGDTIAYFQTSIPFINMMFEDPFGSISLIFDSYSLENYLLFNSQTGYPLSYIYADSQTFTVSRILIPILIISFKSYLLGSIVLSAISFLGSWKLYILFKHIIDDRRISMIAALLIPSVLFWGAGISKDTITLTSASYLVYAFYFTVIKKNISLGRILGLGISLFLIISIKPYIFLVLLPGLLLWFLNAPISKINNILVRRFALPFIAIASALGFLFLFNQFSDLLGAYSEDNILDKALVTQDDLKRDYYGGNSFDIGEVDPTFIGVLSKLPIATFYGLYSPTIFQIQNIVMVFSAIENTILAFLSLRLFITVSPRRITRLVLDNPFFLFCIVFSIAFAFSIGFTTPNYGAMVRFKIPLLPFFVFVLLAIPHKNGQLKN